MRDWHIHLERGPYTVEWAEQFVRRAEKLGIREICLLEHSVRFFEFHPTFTQVRAYNDYQRHWFDEKVQTARHLDEFKRFGDKLRAKNYPVTIKLGLEICYFPQHADVIEQVTRDGYFDLLLGSVHWIDNWTFNQRKNQWQGRDVNALYRRYFELQNQAADSGLFDILAHPDLIRCFGFAPDFNLNEQYKTLCQKVKAQGMLLEMNGSQGPGLHPDFFGCRQGLRRAVLCRVRRALSGRCGQKLDCHLSPTGRGLNAVDPALFV